MTTKTRNTSGYQPCPGSRLTVEPAVKGSNDAYCPKCGRLRGTRGGRLLSHAAPPGQAREEQGA